MTADDSLTDEIINKEKEKERQLEMTATETNDKLCDTIAEVAKMMGGLAQSTA